MTSVPLTAPHEGLPLPGFEIVSPQTLATAATLADSDQVGATRVIPDFTLHPQQQSNWCWLATSSDVHNFYLPAAPITQCALAGGVLFNDPTRCCTSPVPGACNQPGLPSTALRALGNLMGAPFALNTLSYPQVQTEINAGRPIIVGYTQPQQQVGHAVLLLGYTDVPTAASKILVGDPARGYLEVSFSDLLFTYSRYASEVCFTHS